MDIIKSLEPEKIAYGINSLIVIGKAQGMDCIYIVSAPTVDKDSLKEHVSGSSPGKKVKFIFTTRLIYPASEMHLRKYNNSYRYYIETYEDYLRKGDFLKNSWIDNIILKKDVQEKVFFENDDYLIIADYKWDQADMEKAYLLLIFKDSKLRSLRDLEDTEILIKAKKIIYETTKSLGIPEESLCIFFHYRPSYFRLHIHIVNISRSIHPIGSFSRIILLDDAIMNLNIDPGYYKKECCYIGLIKE